MIPAAIDQVPFKQSVDDSNPSGAAKPEAGAEPSGMDQPMGAGATESEVGCR